jgi:predicted dinucleotide-binding enzyme
VVFSYSRSRQKLERLARDAGASAHVGIPADATQDADAVLLAVHWTRVDDVLAQAGTLSGKALLTCSLPMSKDDTHMVIGHTTSGAEVLAAKAPIPLPAPVINQTLLMIVPLIPPLIRLGIVHR